MKKTCVTASSEAKRDQSCSSVMLGTAGLFSFELDISITAFHFRTFFRLVQ